MITVFLNNLTQIFTIILLIIVIIYSCVLFTNAIEHLGKKLKLGNNAVGSILAVIGTSLPETIVPIIAIVSSYFFAQDVQIGKEVALGAIIGSPFMLITFALGLLGLKLTYLFLSKKRKTFELNADFKPIIRNCKYFIIAYFIIFLAAFIENTNIKISIAIFLLFYYLMFISRTIKISKQNFIEEELDELIFQKPFKRIKNSNYFLILFQIVISLIIMTITIHFFVSTIENISTQLKVSPIILSLLITPFATELPECFNSVIWLKNKKDDLAISNILGGTIFQVTIPASIGILFTPWVFNKILLGNIICTFLALCTFLISIISIKKVKGASLLICGIFYFGFLLCVILK